MSNLITESIIIYRKLEQIYKDSVYTRLQTPADELKKIFSELLDARSEEFHLKKENSVYDTKYYYIKTRVKDPSSFYEKLIRKELGIKLTSDLGLLSKSEDIIKEKKGEIVNAIQKLDDIIGLRIVTELKEDCNNVLGLLSNSAEVFLANDIQIDDLALQPQKMRNGLDIFRIKGTYQNLYGFELQIKSKINETWGDLDHTLFYKDYTISPIKDTVQITMNNVGNLLDKIECLLYDLRESGGNYDNNADQLQIQKALEDELSPLLKASYGVTYNIKELSFYLHNFRSKLNVGQGILNNIDFDYTNFEVKEEIVRRYVDIRNLSQILITLEAVYINWLGITGREASNENIDEILKGYITLMSELIKRDVINDITLEDFDFDNYFNELILHKASSDVFLNPKLHRTAITISNRVIGILNDFYENDQIPQKVANLFCIHFFKGDWKTFEKKCVEDEINLTDALFKIKEQVKEGQSQLDGTINKMLINILEGLTNESA